MTDRQRPDFIIAAQEVYKNKLQAAEQEGAKQREKEFKMMFAAMLEILGNSAQIVIEDGQAAVVNDMHSWVWGNLAFNPVTGWNCSVKPQFRFAVVDPSRETLSSVTGWHIVNDLEDMGRYLSEGVKRLENRRVIEATAKTIPVPRNAARMYETGKRFQEGTAAATDRLLIAILEFFDDFTGNEYYDDDDDDETEY